MIEIDARCVIFNLMQTREQLDISVLADFATNLKKLIPSAYVDISTKSIESVLQQYSNIFSFDGNVIKRKEGFSRLASRDFINSTINYQFSKQTRKHLEDVSNRV